MLLGVLVALCGAFLGTGEGACRNRQIATINNLIFRLLSTKTQGRFQVRVFRESERQGYDRVPYKELR